MNSSLTRRNARSSLAVIRNGTTAPGVTKRFEVGRSMATVGGKSGTGFDFPSDIAAAAEPGGIGQLEPELARLLDQQGVLVPLSEDEGQAVGAQLALMCRLSSKQSTASRSGLVETPSICIRVPTRARICLSAVSSGQPV